MDGPGGTGAFGRGVVETGGRIMGIGFEMLRACLPFPSDASSPSVRLFLGVEWKKVDFDFSKVMLVMAE
jgi:hypothetical protein